MKRRSAIAVAGAVTGVLIAGSVASVAVINAASSSTAAQDVPIVAASAAVPESAPVIVPEAGAESAPLPEIVIPEPVISSSEPTSGEPSGKAATPTAGDSASVTELAVQTITAQAARQAATAATPGSVLDTSRVQRAGYDAYAVQIERADGSIVTGYVEATSGVVFDWVVDQKAPTPKATYEDYEDEDDHDEEHDEDDDEEYDEDHDGDHDEDGDDD